MVEDIDLEEPHQGEPAHTANLGTILVVEDDPRMQKVLRRIFAEQNYHVVVAGDGQSGRELFRSERPLAVVLDLILPNISGRELCQTFQEYFSRHVCGGSQRDH